ncbi:hypothetical protein C0J52_16293 [Blattella germanica]|nr:hypothetical protein C0J52_16293 [Blattella germanica]
MYDYDFYIKLFFRIFNGQMKKFQATKYRNFRQLHPSYCFNFSINLNKLIICKLSYTSLLGDLYIPLIMYSKFLVYNYKFSLKNRIKLQQLASINLSYHSETCSL